MDTHLTYSSISAIFAIMLVGALIPSVSVITVATRSASFGFLHGVFTTVGIASGDILFIVLAIFGLSVLAENMGDYFVLVKYAGGAYIIWLGFSLWRSSSNAIEAKGTVESSLLSSFIAGLVITLADQKALLFYFGFFPAFVDLPSLSYIDTGIIIFLALLALSSKLVYALMADKASLLLKKAGLIKQLNTGAGTIILGAGVYIIISA